MKRHLNRRAATRAGLLAVVGLLLTATLASAYWHRNRYLDPGVVVTWRMDTGDTGDQVESYARYAGSGDRYICVATWTAGGQQFTGSTCNWYDAFQRSGWNNVFAGTRNNTHYSQITEYAHGNYH